MHSTLLHRLLLPTVISLTILWVPAVPAAPPDVGESEFIGQTVALFTNEGTGNANNPYYDTNSSHTNYAFTAGLGLGLGNDFEAGFSVGYGRLSTSECGLLGCNTGSVSDRQWSVFVRHNFVAGSDGNNYAFSGFEFSAVYPDAGFGRITMLRPYVGYRFGLPQDWALELAVGGAQVVSGTAAISSGYEVRLGLAIPL